MVLQNQQYSENKVNHHSCVCMHKYIQSWVSQSVRFLPSCCCRV